MIFILFCAFRIKKSIIKEIKRLSIIQEKTSEIYFKLKTNSIGKFHQVNCNGKLKFNFLNDLCL